MYVFVWALTRRMVLDSLATRGVADVAVLLPPVARRPHPRRLRVLTAVL